jgi:hypothetical protein
MTRVLLALLLGLALVLSAPSSAIALAVPPFAQI